MKTFLIPIVLTLLFLSMADFQPNSPLRLGFVGNAEAIIGRPLTPMSYAGVARRSMYREAAVASTVAVTSAAAMNAAAANAAYANAAAAQAAAANAAAAQAAAANAAAAAAAAQQAAAGLPIGTMVPSLPPGMHLDGDRRDQLFPVRRRLLPGRFSGQQHRVYSVRALRARSRLLKTFRRFMLRLAHEQSMIAVADTEPIALSMVEGRARPIACQRTRRVRLRLSVFVRFVSNSS